MFSFLKPQTNYDRSNKITSVKMNVSTEAVLLGRKILVSSDAETREKLGVELLDHLCDASGIDIVDLKIIDNNQVHRKKNGRIVMKKYGSYQPATKFISISNRTATRGQILAPKSFLDTLLHEWIHHYDFQKLRLNSIHSKGFYMRLNDLKEKLQIPKLK